MKRMGTVRKWAVAVAVCLAVLCLPGYSEPTPEQVKERTELLIQAIDNGNVEQAKACIKLGADVNGTVTDKYGDTRPMLIHAILKKNKEITKLLIQAGADVNAKADKGGTALMFAETKDMAELLIKAGADVNAKTPDGWTALNSAIAIGPNDIIAELLIKAGADVNAKTDGGGTVLMDAVRNGGNKIAELLIKAGADVNAKADDGWTALMEAARNGNNKIAELLIKAGTDVNATDDYDGSALMLAIREHIHPLFTINPWMTEAEVANAKTATRLTAELLVKAGADIDTLFIHTIKHRINDVFTRNNVSEPYLNEAMVKLFIDLGANPNAKDSEGISVLTYAMLYARNDIADLLRAAGARE